MQALTSYLRKSSDQNPTASYYNVDVLKYQVSRSGVVNYNPNKISGGRELYSEGKKGTFPPKCFTLQTSLRKKHKKRAFSCNVF